MVGLVRITLRLLADILQLAVSMLRPASALATENLVYRRQLALYRERGLKSRRVDPTTRASLAFLTRFIDWRAAVIVVRTGDRDDTAGVSGLGDSGVGVAPEVDTTGVGDALQSSSPTQCARTRHSRPAGDAVRVTTWVHYGSAVT
jgi:hypothetical protein